MNSAMLSAIRIHSLAAMLALTVLAIPARAADALFPTGSRIGLVPPDGMVPGKTFPGFGDPQKDIAIVINTLPAEAFDSLDKSAVPDVLRKQGMTVDKREPFELKDGKGFLVTGIEMGDKQRYRKWILVAVLDDLTALVTVQAPEQEPAYPDKILRAALATLTVRAVVPDAERLSMLPFTIGDLAGFRIGEVWPGRAVMLIDGRADHEPDTSGFPLNARLLIAALPGGPAEPDDRATFARVAFDSIAGIRDVHIQIAEPLRIGNQQGFQTVAQAKDGKTGSDIMVVQWLRFGGGAFMQMIGISRADVWGGELTRLRTVRDSIDLK